MTQVEFWLAYYSGTPEAELISVENLELAELESLFSKYKAVSASQGKINGSAGSDEDVSISMLFSYTKSHKNKRIDMIIPIAAIALIALVLIEGGFQLALMLKPPVC